MFFGEIRPLQGTDISTTKGNKDTKTNKICFAVSEHNLKNCGSRIPSVLRNYQLQEY